MPLYATQYIHSYAVNSHGFCRAFLFHSLFRCPSYPCGAYSGPWRLYLLINLQSEQNCKNLPQFFCRYFSCCTLLFVVHHILVEPPTPCRLSSQHSTSTYFVNLYRQGQEISSIRLFFNNRKRQISFFKKMFIGPR